MSTHLITGETDPVFVLPTTFQAGCLGVQAVRGDRHAKVDVWAFNVFQSLKKSEQFPTISQTTTHQRQIAWPPLKKTKRSNCESNTKLKEHLSEKSKHRVGMNRTCNFLWWRLKRYWIICRDGWGVWRKSFGKFRKCFVSTVKLLQ